MQQNQIFAGRYRLIEKIGTGGFSVVWLSKDEMTENTEVAIKIFAPDKGLDQNGIKQFSREYAITAKLKHLHLLKPSHFSIFKGSPYLILPFCSKGSLQNVLDEKGSLSEEEILNVIKDVANGLNYLHKHNILHQDIKPDNILIDDDGRYMLTDFGISTRMRNTLKKATSNNHSLTLAYAPPERYSAHPENTKAGDIFSLGVMLYELATGDVPWDGNGGVMLLKGAEIPKIPDTCSKELQDLVYKCMSKEKEGRPTAEELLNIIKTISFSETTSKERERSRNRTYRRKGGQTEKYDFINAEERKQYEKALELYKQKRYKGAKAQIKFTINQYGEKKAYNRLLEKCLSRLEIMGRQTQKYDFINAEERKQYEKALELYKQKRYKGAKVQIKFIINQYGEKEAYNRLLEKCAAKLEKRTEKNTDRFTAKSKNNFLVPGIIIVILLIFGGFIVKNLYFDKTELKPDLEKRWKAIADYTKVLEVDPDKKIDYNKRGLD